MSPGSRPVAFTRSPLRETLVVPELQPGEIDCLEIDAPVEPPPPPPSPGAAEEGRAAAPAAPGSAPGRIRGTASTAGRRCSTRRRSPTSSSSRGRATEASRRRCSPPRRPAAPAARRDHRDNGDPTLMSWRYVAAEFPSERYLHLTVKGQGVFCRSRCRPHRTRTSS